MCRSIIMRIYRLQVKNFRGIKSLDWLIKGRVACLIGPGDSTKTTILDAIEYALNPRYNLQFTDVDFYNAVTSEGIEIIVTVGDLPARVKDEGNLGLYLQGWDAVRCSLSDSGEPEESCEQVVSIRLKVDSALEPSWTAITVANNEGIMVSSRLREQLGMARLGEHIDQELSWGKGSALFKSTGDISEALSALRDAGRQACDAVDSDSMQLLSRVAREAHANACEFAALGCTPYSPALDPHFLFGRTTAISLHQGNIPLRLSGLATRRIVALALQKQSVKGGAILLVDELEHGLEPYRIRHLVRKLQSETRDSKVGQVIITSHSPTVLVEMDANEVYIVRSTNNGTTIVQEADSQEMKKSLRRFPEAYFAPSIVVCEGATEWGMILAFRDYWADNHEQLTYEHKGVAIIDGEGNNAQNLAYHLSMLGYQVSLFRDSDEDLKPEYAKKLEGKVKIIQWSDKCATEQRIAMDIPLENINELTDLASTLNSNDKIKADFENKYGVKINNSKLDLIGLTEEGIPDSIIRSSLGEAAKAGRWFKNIPAGEELGKYIIGIVDKISPEKDLMIQFSELEKWIYAS